MTAHLLALSIGPVQDFIAAARRTRDLWFGSWLLSEISKASAWAVRNSGGSLVFPAPQTDDDLVAGSDLNVANVILAELPENLKPEDVRQRAYDEAQACWKRHAQTAKDRTQSKDSSLVADDIWKEQVDDIIEFYAAWIPLTSPYKVARQKVMQLLAGRKACRNFVPVKGRVGVPKSSLDGARETVLICGRSQRETRELRGQILQQEQNRELAQCLRLSAGEELDVIGLTKRAATKESFPSIVRVAADPWIQGISERGGEASDLLRQISRMCEGAAFATGTGKYYRGIFPYDGSVLYPSRLASMIRATKNAAQDFDDFALVLSAGDQTALGKVKICLDKLQKDPPAGLGCGAPDPYVAILVADGDRMGKVISSIDSAQEHIRLSQHLAQFAEQAKGIIEARHGCLVYSGGDDVLAFVPVDHCLGCARVLHDKFEELMEQWKDNEGNSPTLSVGLAIAHCLEPMEDLLEYGRDAEKAAKYSNRNGLAVHLHPRGGVPIQLRAQWSSDEQSLDNRLASWADLHRQDLIPDKAAYDLRELIREYEAWPIGTAEQRATLASALRSDSLQMLKRKKGGKGDEGLAKLESLLSVAESVKEALQVADEVILARRIAVAQAQATSWQTGTETMEDGK